LALFASGSAIALRIDLRMPGTEGKYIVSCMAFQASSATSTAELRLSVTRMDSCDSQA
jgi:hypothetical protein